MTSATITIERDEDEWADEGWTALPNWLIRSSEMTDGEKITFAWFKSHVKDFQFTLDDLADDNTRGRNYVRGNVRGLERHGLVTRRQERNSAGQIVAVRYKLHPRPVPEERRTYVESAAKKKVMTDEAKDALRGTRRSDPAPGRQGAGGPGAGGPGAGRSVLPYKEEKTTREDQQELPSSPAAPPSADHPPEPEAQPEPPRLDIERLCVRLRDRMIENGCRPPTITKGWRDAARLLLDKDGRDLAKALNLIDWVAADEFWRANIQSMPKFRAQYDQLRLRALADHEQKRRTANGPPGRRSQTAVAAETTRAAFAQYRAGLAADDPLALTAGPGGRP